MQPQQDHVVQEYPVALVYNGISHAVMMATPTDLKLFAQGFSLSEGIINQLKQLYAIDMIRHDDGIEIIMEISSQAMMALKSKRRVLTGRSGCGLCGIDSLQHLQQDLPKVSHHLQQRWLQDIPKTVQALSAQQTISAVTGGAHAAAWIENGQIMAVFEDVGRHNALDKLLGWLSVEQRDSACGFVLMTSRASYELIRKCAVFNIALLATISAPTSMAIDLAKSAGLSLASFCRGDNFVIYN
nr:formate dehydrogenase accessory sulfurtransferase FdhD [Acinetobacter larvae]